MQRIVDTQQAAFKRAIADRLGIDPTTASFEGWNTNGDAGWIDLRFHIAAEELRALWAAAAPPPTPRDVRNGDRLRMHNGQDGYVDVVVGEVHSNGTPDGGLVVEFAPVVSS